MSMMVPGYALIAEVMLFSEGFEDSKVLARKMVNLYKLASEQLSQQPHYDFGMRALKSVLVMAGSLKRASPNDPESAVLICAMRDSNVPKFLPDDEALFRDIVGDLFPDAQVEETCNTALVQAAEWHLQQNDFQTTDTLLDKVVQLKKTLDVRFGVMLVGPTGSGKTTILHTLTGALTRMRQHEQVHDDRIQVTHLATLNPKCITMGELYGEYDELTNEWKDGVGSSLIRAAVADTSPDHRYVCFDGPGVFALTNPADNAIDMAPLTVSLN
jgi:dynein heavy chain, axonemal